MKISLKDNFKGLFFFRGWHPEVSLRYLPIVSKILKMGRNISVLDVGSGGLGIAPYLRRPVTGLDLKFKPPYHERMMKIKASVLKLPFADSTFDAVVSVDMLEHLDQKDRSRAISEMLRVSKKALFLAVPSGRLSWEQDVRLSDFYKKKYGKSYHFFEEQIGFGLPEWQDLENQIRISARNLNKKIRLESQDNENLHLREFLMKGWMTNNMLVDIFFRKVLLLVLPIMYKMNSKPGYRRIFTAYVI